MPSADATTWVVVLGSHKEYHSSACWVFDNQDTAERFAAYVTREIDPARVLKALDPVAELLTWRQNHLTPSSPEDASPF